ncbi:preprotein translocase subunit SecE [Spiroplasma endosymbiont of Virgichneumon dumeticola]|uniref:preprotein translocase subunit SecE n=1 Tax=Spiroplasma endosymbiont of Virgichneumon dumeticola TaxID=3139323 RepID=UPI0035C90077
MSEENKSKKSEINHEKVALLKNKFNILRKIKPLKTKRTFEGTTETFNPRTADKNKKVDISAIWEKERKNRTLEERYYYKREARTYHKYFFLYLSREVRRTRWTPRKQLNSKFLTTVAFITVLALFFYAIESILLVVLPLLKIM